MAGSIDYSQPSLWLAAAAIAFNPTFWNIAARQEYHNKTITKLFRGNSLYGCYALALTIFSLGIIRDSMYIPPFSFSPFSPLLCNIDRKLTPTPSYHNALSHQPTSKTLVQSPLTKPMAALLFSTGNILVLSSMYALGITGTYLGDYFGILMDAKVTGFPFNVTDAPMYWGSTMSFLATALWYGKPAGVLLTLLVYWAYRVALMFEDPFTGEIYAKRDRERAEKGKKTS
ncbi:hypothetical protein LTS18_009584 [Coniosporium uncinatum]|uniref:Uncharacterized protein n=1 Tax=Coniosporium uncinatum TaxID=93489 RepID=A0ACC3DM76_9PEZI|nr:hypothetical protein LTS18_009584 [Coniosporium uncinatum]